MNVEAGDPDYYVGIEVLSTEPEKGRSVAPEEYVDSGRHSPSGRQGASRYVAELGADAVRTTGRLIGKITSEVIEEALAEIGNTSPTSPTGNQYDVASLQLTYGVKLTGGAGKFVEAVVSATGEASFQVVVNISKRPVE